MLAQQVWWAQICTFFRLLPACSGVGKRRSRTMGSAVHALQGLAVLW